MTSAPRGPSRSSHSRRLGAGRRGARVARGGPLAALFVGIAVTLSALMFGGMGAPLGAAPPGGTGGAPALPLLTSHRASEPAPTTPTNGSGWEQLTAPTQIGSPNTTFAAMVYDPVANVDVLVPATNSVDNCAYLFSGTAWSSECAPSLVPPNRWQASFAWDPAGSAAVLFGGATNDYGQATNATWSYGVGGWSLDPLFNDSPPSRWGAALAWDPGLGTLVLFGGTNGTTTFNDTWTFNRTDWAWARLATSVAPPARSGATFVYDPLLQADVLFGGVTANGSRLSDTWTFADGRWTAPVLSGPSPSGRSNAAAAFDAPLGAVVLYGGATATAAAVNDTWTFAGGGWSGPTGRTYPYPNGRAFSTLATAPQGNGLLLVDGSDGGNDANGTWLYYTVSPWLQSSSVHLEGSATVTLSGGAVGGIPPLSFAWQFGDGDGGAGPNVSHAYDATGRYVVGLVVTDADGVQGTYTREVIVVAPLALVASLTPTTGLAPLSVTGTASPTLGAAPYRVTWRFSDGPSVTSPFPVGFAYPTPGAYDVSVWGNDSFGYSVQRNFTVEVRAPAAAASLNATILVARDSGVAPATLQFTGTSTGAAPATTFAWSFGDGTGATGPTVAHTFGASGRYDVELTAFAADGVTGNASATVDIVPALSLSLALLPETPSAGQAVALRATANGGAPPYQYFWQLGGGLAGEGANVSTVFAHPGTVPVEATVVDAWGDRTNQTLELAVVAPPPSASVTPSLAGSSTVAVIEAALAGVLVGVGVELAVHRFPGRPPPAAPPSAARRAGRAVHGPRARGSLGAPSPAGSGSRRPHGHFGPARRAGRRREDVPDRSRV